MLQTVSFSGCKLSNLRNNMLDVESKIDETINKCISRGFNTFLLGVEKGLHEYVADSIIKVKRKYPNTKLVYVLSNKDQKHLIDSNLYSHINEIICLSDDCYSGYEHNYSRYLIDNSNLLICYYDGQDGETSYTFEYALKQNKEILNLYENVYNETLTQFHAKYYVNELLRKKSCGNDDRLTATLFNSVLEINPHQIEAALFALKSPLSKGVILADEVGLGKTIEAGLVMCQLYAEQKTNQLIICPAFLRKQWAFELEEKFGMSSFILEARTWEEYKTKRSSIGISNSNVVITSYNFASKMHSELGSIHWDLVVIDEAHKLRNAYRTSNKTGQNIKIATGHNKKLLLTATPLQNSLVELYGIANVIDEHIFGDIKSFRELYCTTNNFVELKERLSHFCKRTLRKDVTEYVRYTKRIGIQKRFDASVTEQKLYNELSAFLQQDNSYAIPNRQKMITSLIIRKVLASSSWAVKKTLEVILNRLLKIRDGLLKKDEPINNLFDEDEYEIYIETTYEDDENTSNKYVDNDEIDLKQLNYEIDKLNSFINMASSIKNDSKAICLLEALTVGFEETQRLGGNQKALIFTESRRTQDYLKSFLEANGYEGKIVLFNGQNGGKEANDIYKKWYEANKYTNRVSGSKVADTRNALIEYFRDDAKICIATEAAAEGVNLQFCSLVINYDLPWNPQRIEQRIGRCHRYGQKNDVVVINFINNKNQADVRVAELLDIKCKLFDGIFGSSDDVLGIIENGIDFEKRIFKIYQECRTPEEIEKQFDILQKELDDKIKKTMTKTKNILFENFDTEVHERLKLKVSEYLDRYTRIFWRLSKYILNGYAVFFDDYKSFMLKENLDGFEQGRYNLITKEQGCSEGTIYRTTHPLGRYTLSKAQSISDSFGKVIFDITNNKGFKLSLVEQLKRQSGFLSLHKYTISSLEQEEHLLFCGFTNDGKQLTPEQCKKLFDCIGTSSECDIETSWIDKLNDEVERYAEGTLAKTNEKNLLFIHEEQERLDKWAQDMVIALEKELTNIKKQILEIERLIRTATTTTEHLDLQTKLQELNKRKRNMRAKLEENEDEIYDKRNALINEIKTKMTQHTKLEHVFTIKWEVI